MADKAPLFSIITICKNQVEHISETLRSVAEQDYADYEHIVIDGLSTDGTVEKLEALRHPRMTLTSEVDAGIYDAMNKGIGQARGEFLLFLNGGDSLYSTDILRVAAGLVGEADLMSGDICFRFPDGREEIGKAPDHFTAEYMLGATLFHPCTFIRGNCFRKFGLYDESFKIAADYDFFLKCLVGGAKYRNFGKIISKFRRDGMSSLPKFTTTIRLERARAFAENIGLWKWLQLKVQRKFFTVDGRA